MLKKGLFLGLVAALVLIAPMKSVFSANFNELQEQIKSRQSALEELEKQEELYNQELEKTQQDKKTLSGEVSKIKKEINSINFKIKVNQAQLEKLGLELEKLDLESKNTSQGIELKKQVLAEALRSLYDLERKDAALEIILTSSQLSQAMLDIENIFGFGKSVREELEGLKLLKGQLARQKEETKEKKMEQESAEENLKNRKTITSSLKSEKDYLLGQTKNQEKNYQNLLSDIEKKRAEVEAEISRLEESLKAQIDPDMLPKALPGIIEWPTQGRLSQRYGETEEAKYFYRRGIYTKPFHNGIDIAAPLSAPIYAAENGEVVAVGNQDNYCYRAAYGKFIVVSHDNNLTTLYAHLSLYNVKAGDSVKRGQIIGYMGRTGASTGSHLHFTVYFTPTFRMTKSNFCGPMPVGGPVNPLGYLE